LPAAPGPANVAELKSLSLSAANPVKPKAPAEVRMQDLARLAGCSVATVSLALRGSAEVSEDTRRRIAALARKHGYRANPLVSALMTARRRRSAGARETLAVLTKFDTPISAWRARQPFYSDVWEGMRARSAEIGFALEEFATWAPERLSGPRLSGILRARGIRGVLLMPGGGLEREFPALAGGEFAVVAAAFHGRDLPVHRTASDHAAGVAICVEEARRRGYRRIGLTMNGALDPELRFAISGRYLAWQRTVPARERVPLVPGDEERIPAPRLLAWVRAARVDCVLCTQGLYADALAAAGLRVPEELGCLRLPTRGAAGVAGYDAVPREVGRSAVDLLARELFLNHLGEPRYPEVVLVKGRWQDGPQVRSPIGYTATTSA
jgi:DNA-binding LacI/PurR family transcriptional regulator